MPIKGGVASYGYKKDTENKHQLIVDENVSGIVQRIFQLAADGLSAYKIARQLSSEKILTPRAYVAEQHGKYKDCFHPKYPTDWNHGTIVTILQNREYLGYFVGNKSTTKSFKNICNTPVLQIILIHFKNRVKQRQTGLLRHL